MSIINDIIHIADRIFNYLEKRNRSDSSLYNDVIDPLYVELETIVQELIAMYRPVAKELDTLRPIYSDEFNDRFHELIEDVNEDSPTVKETNRWLLSNRLDAEFPHQFAISHENELKNIVEMFKQKRIETRSARIKADAAACALLKHYLRRLDPFATRVCEFATQVRVLVGRAHNSSLEQPNPDWRGKSATDKTERNLEKLVQISRRSYTVDAGDLIPLTKSTEESLDNNINIDLLQLSEYIEETCKMINEAWENIIYIYAAMRLELTPPHDS